MLPTPLRIRKRAAETGQIHLWGARAVHQELIRTLHTLPATIHRVRTRRSREGPNEFVITGIHKDYDITSQLPEVSVPTLFTCGRFDETRPEEAAWLAPATPFQVSRFGGGQYPIALLGEHEAARRVTSSREPRWP